MNELAVLIEGNVLRGEEKGADVAAPSVVFIKSENKKILVDTGLFVAKYRFVLIERLQEMGCTANDIDTIIYTHLHEDHCQNTSLFPNAEIFVGAQETEWMKAELPKPVHSFFLPLGQPVHQVTADTEIDDGVEIILTAGHTAGHISVLVENTKDGKVCVAGDAIGWKSYWDTNTVPPVVWNAECFLQSMRLIREKNVNIIVPGHEAPFVV